MVQSVAVNKIAVYLFSYFVRSTTPNNLQPSSSHHPSSSKHESSLLHIKASVSSHSLPDYNHIQLIRGSTARSFSAHGERYRDMGINMVIEEMYIDCTVELLQLSGVCWGRVSTAQSFLTICLPCELRKMNVNTIISCSADRSIYRHYLILFLCPLSIDDDVMQLPQVFWSQVTRIGSRYALQG